MKRTGSYCSTKGLECPTSFVPVELRQAGMVEKPGIVRGKEHAGATLKFPTMMPRHSSCVLSGTGEEPIIRTLGCVGDRVRRF